MPTLTSNQTPTKDDIIRTLEKLREQKDQRQNYFQPQVYTNFMPNTRQGYQPDPGEQWGQNLQSISQIGKNATELSLVIAQNKAALEAQKKARKQKKYSEQQLAATANATAAGGLPRGPNGELLNSQIPGQPGYNPPAKGFNVNAPIVSQKWHGFTLTMNKSVIGRFTGFLNALAATGYKIKSIGTYANRNIAGTNTQSLHALGLAMDINPSENPVTYNGHNITNLPPNVGALAARYGIAWGGAWLGNKRDPMHFSVPYGGRK